MVLFTSHIPSSRSVNAHLDWVKSIDFCCSVVKRPHFSSALRSVGVGIRRMSRCSKRFAESSIPDQAVWISNVSFRSCT